MPEGKSLSRGHAEEPARSLFPFPAPYRTSGLVQDLFYDIPGPELDMAHCAYSAYLSVQAIHPMMNAVGGTSVHYWGQVPSSRQLKQVGDVLRRKTLAGPAGILDCDRVGDALVRRRPRLIGR